MGLTLVVWPITVQAVLTIAVQPEHVGVVTITVVDIRRRLFSAAGDFFFAVAPG